MKKFLAAGMLALSALSAARAASVVNGSFDELSLAGPSFTLGTSGSMGNNIFGPINGLGYDNTPNGADAGFINSTGAITFLLADLVVGQAYQVSFIDAASTLSSATAATFLVAYNGTGIGSFTPGSTNWMSASTNVFNATGTTGTLTFTGATANTLFGTNHTVGIDSVSIASAGGTAAVPEPATWAMMIGGFGMVGGALRRRRAALSLG